MRRRRVLGTLLVVLLGCLITVGWKMAPGIWDRVIHVEVGSEGPHPDGSVKRSYAKRWGPGHVVRIDDYAAGGWLWRSYNSTTGAYSEYDRRGRLVSRYRWFHFHSHPSIVPELDREGLLVRQTLWLNGHERIKVEERTSPPWFTREEIDAVFEGRLP